MKRLRLLLLGVGFFALTLWLDAQPLADKGGDKNLHEALILVSRLDTRAPIAGAIISNQLGQMLGFTDASGRLTLQWPLEVTESISVRADGYVRTSLQLDRTSQPEATYEVLLDAVSSSKAPEVGVPLSQEMTEAPEMVKVYVRQDKTSWPPQQDPANKPSVQFAVQLSATSRPVSDPSMFKTWESIGPVFIQQEEGLYKVRIGPYATQQEAKQALLKVKERGKADAFIVVQQGREENQGIQRKAADAAQAPTSVPMREKTQVAAPAPKMTASLSSEEGIYKVRLASYLKPGGFNTRAIEEYGTFETYRQGEWTIMLIGGLKSRADAERVRTAVVAKGFRDARVVIDRDGILEDVPAE